MTFEMMDVQESETYNQGGDNLKNELPDMKEMYQDLYNKLSTLKFESDATTSQMIDVDANLRNSNTEIETLKLHVKQLDKAVTQKLQRNKEIHSKLKAQEAKFMVKLKDQEAEFIAKLKAHEAVFMTKLKAHEAEIFRLKVIIESTNEKLSLIEMGNNGKVVYHKIQEEPFNDIHNLSTFKYVSSTSLRTDPDRADCIIEAPKKQCSIQPKDIEMLTFTDISSIHAQAILHNFCKQVRQAGSTEEECINIACARMEKEIRLYVNGEMEEHNYTTLDDVQSILLKDFVRPTNISDAFQELFQLRYSVDMDPREYVNKFRAKFKSIIKAFPSARSINEETLWKQIIMEDLPQEIKACLQNYVKIGMGESFLIELEKERNFYNKGGYDNVKDEAASKANSLSMRSCNWCQNGNVHVGKKCPRKPQPYSCFDCLMPNMCKGNPGCQEFDASWKSTSPSDNYR
ncbi:uncharacterized protein [Palaemon carinicauda]|uniref:uncharacterized protein n=1 Tax=Palaemon carinicauda TaxID=392227 RepID=UPI0035B5E35F